MTEYTEADIMRIAATAFQAGYESRRSQDLVFSGDYTTDFYQMMGLNRSHFRGIQGQVPNYMQQMVVNPQEMEAKAVEALAHIMVSNAVPAMLKSGFIKVRVDYANSSNVGPLGSPCISNWRVITVSMNL